MWTKGAEMAIRANRREWRGWGWPQWLPGVRAVRLSSSDRAERRCRVLPLIREQEASPGACHYGAGRIQAHMRVRFNGGNMKLVALYAVFFASILSLGASDATDRVWRKLADLPTVKAGETGYDFSVSLGRGDWWELAPLTRSVYLQKGRPATGPFVVVVDRLAASDGKAHDYEQIWHLEDCNLKLDARSFFADFGGGQIGLKAVFSANYGALCLRRQQARPRRGVHLVSGQDVRACVRRRTPDGARGDASPLCSSSASSGAIPACPLSYGARADRLSLSVVTMHI